MRAATAITATVAAAAMLAALDALQAGYEARIMSKLDGDYRRFEAMTAGK